MKANDMFSDTTPPLAGVRVLDASRVLAGPFSGQILGDLGAEVIKVERPGQGDETRAWGPPFAGALSAYYLSCNRHKRGLTLDLSKPEGVDVFYCLLEKSDIVLENFRPDSAAKLGLVPEKMLERNPHLIICSISGFGRNGPMKDLPGYDFAIQGLSGLMSITGPVEGPPSKVGVAVTDVLTGLYAAVAVLACLHARKQSGHGYHIDLALLDCAVAAQVNVAQAYLTSSQVPPRQGNAHLQIVPYQAFETADDWLILAVGNDGQFQRFCKAAGREDLSKDARYATNSERVRHRADLIPTVAKLMKARTAADWQKLLLEAEVPHAPVWNYQQLFEHPQAQARGLCVTVREPDGKPVDLVGSPFHIVGATLPAPAMPPGLGQDTEAILTQVLGLDVRTIQQLAQQKII
ncbi:MAG: CoA transferase [Gemmataceae bacterium]|nr:CoA transferase [Gemmataceae bacterium]MCI0740101.1 CoA transferase [Gemmataceae bacterium]